MTLENSTEIMLNATQQMMQKMTQQSDAYFLYILISVLSSLVIYLVIFYVPLATSLGFIFTTKRLLHKIVKTNHRNVVVMSHRQAGLFGSMITMEDAMKFEQIIRKFKTKGIDFILNTYGGDLFASMRLAMLIRHHGDVRVFVPKYAWSGGTLISLAADEIHMGKIATLSPVDVQIGNIIKIFAGKYWKKIVEKKNMKANDETIAFSMLSEQLLEEQKTFLNDLMQGRNIDMDKFFDTFLTGEHSHGKQITLDELKALGLNVKLIETTIYDNLIEKTKKQGVFGQKA